MNAKYTCRFCLKESDDINTLISPCKCSGGSKYVHRECLDTWRGEDLDSNNFKRCNTCLFNYTIIQKDEDTSARDYLFYSMVMEYLFDICFNTIILIFIIVTILYFVNMVFFRDKRFELSSSISIAINVIPYFIVVQAAANIMQSNEDLTILYYISICYRTMGQNLLSAIIIAICLNNKFSEILKQTYNKNIVAVYTVMDYNGIEDQLI
jgi:hypothetical protein